MKEASEIYLVAICLASLLAYLPPGYWASPLWNKDLRLKTRQDMLENLCFGRLLVKWVLTL